MPISDQIIFLASHNPMDIKVIMAILTYQLKYSDENRDGTIFVDQNGKNISITINTLIVIKCIKLFVDWSVSL